MSWHLLEKVLDVVAKQSTVIGKVWITLLFMFRIIALTRMAENLYSDEHGAFKCNTRQPGCENMCFNEFSPISHVRYWGFQTIITATPSIIFIVYAAHMVSKLPIPKKLRKRNMKNRRRKLTLRQKSLFVTPMHQYTSKTPMNESNKIANTSHSTTIKMPMFSTIDKSSIIPTQTSVSFDVVNSNSFKSENAKKESTIEIENSSKPLKTLDSDLVPRIDRTEDTLTTAYKMQCLARTFLEIVFLSIQCVMFGFEVPQRYECTAYPCPNTVDCFVSRPGEKSSMLIYMFLVTILCILLSIFEMHILSDRTVCIKMQEFLERKGIRLCCTCGPNTSSLNPKNMGSDSDSEENPWFFVENLLDRSMASDSSGSSSSEDSDDSIDSCELDEMYEQECEMDTNDYDGGADNDDF